MHKKRARFLGLKWGWDFRVVILLSSIGWPKTSAAVAFMATALPVGFQTMAAFTSWFG
jgi:hypothetical protein